MRFKLLTFLILTGLTLDDCSFELVKHKTTLSTVDFYNENKITDVYHEEIKELLKKVGKKFKRKLHT